MNETPRGVCGIHHVNETTIMTNQEIVDLFDSTNITMARLALISGRDIAELKKLLMGGAS